MLMRIILIVMFALAIAVAWFRPDNTTYLRAALAIAAGSFVLQELRWQHQLDRRKPSMRILPPVVGAKARPSGGHGWSFCVTAQLMNNSSSRITLTKGDAELTHPLGPLHLQFACNSQEILPDGGSIRLDVRTKTLDCTRDELPTLRRVRFWILGSDKPFEWVAKT